MNDYWNDPPEAAEPPDWYCVLEDAANEPGVPQSVSIAVLYALECWANSINEHWEPVPFIETPLEANTCRTCGKPTECIYCSEECSPPCVHGHKPGHCDTCDHLADLAYDAARENRYR
jgi:hypothetical protein